MDEQYDVIVCGTGLKECILSGLLSVSGKKVLHVDRNGYYGGECASLNLTTLYEKFRSGQSPPPSYGPNRDWNIDLIPKFIMANGDIVKILLKTKVTRYLEWKSVDGTFVYQYQPAGIFQGAKYIHKVPSTDMEALKSPLMGMIEKTRCMKFFQFVANFDPSHPTENVHPIRTTMAQLYEKFGLQPDTIDFVGHALALYINDDYMHRPCGATIEKIQLYMTSISRFGNSPFVYPIYGLSGLPESFSRLSAVHGGTYMLNKPVDGFEFGPDGKVTGVRSGDEVARAPIVICDPSYVTPTNPSAIRSTGKVIRAICILGAPIPNTNNCVSCQIIIPQKQLHRKSDIYVMMVSHAHSVATAGKYIAIVSATVETAYPEREIQPALDLLGPIENKFVSVSELHEPVDATFADNVYITKSYDPTSHFESAAREVLELWQKITGSPLDLSIDPAELANEEQ
jgi:Rab GDP dissociation inhibitor